MQETKPNNELIDGLREMADFLEAHPELPKHWGSTIFNLFTYGDKAKSEMAHFAKITGHVEKNSTDNTFYLSKKFKGGIKLEMNASRDLVCERVQVSTTIEPEHIIPAQPETVVPEREVPVYEWHCGSILADTEVAA